MCCSSKCIKNRTLFLYLKYFRKFYWWSLLNWEEIYCHDEKLLKIEVLEKAGSSEILCCSCYTQPTLPCACWDPENKVMPCSAVLLGQKSHFMYGRSHHRNNENAVLAWSPKIGQWREKRFHLGLLVEKVLSSLTLAERCWKTVCLDDLGSNSLLLQ